MGSLSAVRDATSSVVVRVAVEDLAAHLDNLEAELSGAGTLEITRGDNVIAEMRAPEMKVEARVGPGRAEPPDFMARLRKIYGDKPLDVDTTEWVSEGRE